MNYKQINPEQLQRMLIVNPEDMVVKTATEMLTGMIVLVDIMEGEEVKEEEPKKARKKVKPTPDMMPFPRSQKRKWKIDRDEVCRLRNEQGLSIDELASRMECSTQTITNILTQLRSEGRLNECV